MKIKARGLLFVAACGLVESVTWLALALLSVLVYACVIKMPERPDPTIAFGVQLAKFYIADDSCEWSYLNNASAIMELTPPNGVLIINCIVIASSFLWLVASALLVWEAVRVVERSRPWLLWCWVAITAFVCVSDLGIFINFAVDYSNTVSRLRTMMAVEATMEVESLDMEPLAAGTVMAGLELLMFSGFMMAIAARGYMLWLLNVAAALWVGFQALGGGCHGDDQDERASLKHHFLTSLYGGRQQDKPDGLSSPWAVQSPVVGTAPRPPPWTPRGSSAYEIPRPFRLGPPPPGRAVTKPIPEPDYDQESLSRTPAQMPPRSPPHAKDALRRQPPPLDEMPRRSALKKVNTPQPRFSGKTVF